MKILLVGANSSLGLELKPLLDKFAEVVTAGRSGCDIQMDLAAPVESIRVPPGFDAVINTAAHFSGKCAADMIEAENVNVLGTLKLLHACSQAAVGHFVQVSSIFAGLMPTSQFYSIYSLTKKHADEVAQLYSVTFGTPLLIVRPAQMYGVGEAYRRNQPFLYSIMDKAQQNEDIVIFGSNDALRNFIHVEDVAMAITLAVRCKLVGNYNCVYPENLRYSQIVHAAAVAFGSSSRVLFAPEYNSIPDNPFESDDALYQAIGYFPQISIIAGMQKEAAHRRTCS
jgi:nucleoside-diphosphate-sugar epimerase